MNIALLGYGKMGQAVEAIAIQRGHNIVCKVSIENLEDRSIANIRKADAVIEFTGPDSAFDNIKLCIDAGVPVVSGSTGWLDRFDEIKQYVAAKGGALLYASNFSIGVNIFFALNEKLAELMAGHPEYAVDMKEIHHTQKLDAPSGTAITLAGQIIEKLSYKKRWVNQASENKEELPIISERRDPAPGTHSIRYHSAIDDIEITHTAHNRMGFASGAALAAEFIRGKKGIFTMNEVLGI